MNKVSKIISGIYFLVGGVAYIYLWTRHQRPYDLAYGLGCIYAALSVVFTKLPIVITRIVTAWVVIDQVRALASTPLTAVLNILLASPILIQSWKDKEK